MSDAEKNNSGNNVGEFVGNVFGALGVASMLFVSGGLVAHRIQQIKEILDAGGECHNVRVRYKAIRRFGMYEAI